MNWLGLVCGLLQLGASVLEIRSGKYYYALLWASVGIANLVMGSGKLGECP